MNTKTFVEAISARWMLILAGVLLPAALATASGTAAAGATSTPVKEAAVPELSVVDLQAGRTIQTATLSGSGPPAFATLVNLAPGVGDWYLLTIAPAVGPSVDYHLESAGAGRVELVPGGGGSLRLTAGGRSTGCVPWIGEGASELARARASGLPFAPICGERLYLRNPATGRRSNLEKVTDFLRDRVHGGEKITVFVRDTVFKDRYLQTAAADSAVSEHTEPAGAPPPVAISPRHADATVAPSYLALALDGVRHGRLEVGRWYQATGVPGVFSSALLPGQVVGLGEGLAGKAAPLDEVESIALTFLVAYDLARHELGFAIGTDHPRVFWSDRVPQTVRKAALPGPDGIGTVAPLARAGVLAPHLVGRVTSTFTGGFKRSHGAFMFGELSRKNGGSHYGFVESGTVLSRLQPGLATAVVWNDGTAELLTWRQDLDARISDVRHARQNGVALVEPDLVTGEPRPGALLTRWGEGNWSGSEDKKLRTLRAGLCQAEGNGSRYLLYGYFSGATPSAMARVFLAAGCSYAMLLDMNALEHTYLALYRTVAGRFLTEHLVDGMEVLDPEKDAGQLPRFVAVPDNRDFFYLLRKKVQ